MSHVSDVSKQSKAASLPIASGCSISKTQKKALQTKNGSARLFCFKPNLTAKTETLPYLEGFMFKTKICELTIKGLSLWKLSLNNNSNDGERIIGAEKGTEKIAVEIKSFLKESFIYDFYEAFGQYLVYEDFLSEQDPERTLYLAITEDVFTRKFKDDTDVLRICRKYRVKILIIDAYNQIIEQWIK
jgi:XisH protein